MTKELSLSRIISRNLGFTPGTKEFSFVFLNSVRYLLHAISATEFNRRLKLVIKNDKDVVSAKDFRLLLSCSGYAMLRVKLHVIDAVTNRRCKNFVLKSSFKKFGIKKSDRAEIEKVYRDNEIQVRVRKLVSEFGNKYNLPTLAEVMDTLATIIKRLSARVRNTVARKLRFILTANNLDRMDLENELFAKMVQAYYWQIPLNRTVDQLVLNMSRVIKNAAINLIEHWTFQKRSRMYKDEEDNFKLRESSSNLIPTRTEDGEEVVPEHEIDAEFSHKLELHVATKQLYAQFATTEKRTRILKMLMGYFDAEFTQWLKKNRYITRSGDNVTFQEQVTSKRFLQVTAKFMRIRREKFMRWIERMKFAMTNYLSEVSQDGTELTAAAA